LSAEDYGSRRFGNVRNDPGGTNAIYGTVDASAYTKVTCPWCNRTIWVPRGHHDTTHDCSILCPYSGDTMLSIPGDPSTAVVPLLIKHASELVTAGYQTYFTYCPNPQCQYFLDKGVAYMSRRVPVDILVGR